MITGKPKSWAGERKAWVQVQTSTFVLNHKSDTVNLHCAFSHLFLTTALDTVKEKPTNTPEVHTEHCRNLGGHPNIPRVLLLLKTHL